MYSSLLHHRRCFSHIWYGWKIRHWPRHHSACGLTDNRSVSLDTVTKRHYSAPRQWYIWLKQLLIIWAEIRVKRAQAPNPALSLICWLICQHRWAAAVRSTVAVCHAVWSCSRTVSGAVNITVDTTCRPQTRGRQSPCLDRASQEPRGPSSTSLAPSTVTAPVCLSYRKCRVDLAGTRYTMCCSFRTAPTAFTWTSEGRQGESYGILLLATDAARRPGLNVVL